MLGLLALVSLVAAMVFKGWWWVAFACLCLTWINNLVRGKKAKAKRKLLAEKVADQASKQDWPSALIDVASSLKGPDFYVGAIIPATKRAEAMLRYPLPGDGTILALIDATAFGSAANGLAVGRDGIAWKNMLSPPVQITWKQLARHEVRLCISGAAIGPKEFYGGPTSLKSTVLEAYFRRLQTYAQAAISADSSTARSDAGAHMASVPSERGKARVAVNSANVDDLLTLPGIGAAEAQSIIKRRGERMFTSTLELVDFLELKPHFAQRLEGLVVYDAPLASMATACPPKQPLVNEPPIEAFGGRTID